MLRLVRLLWGDVMMGDVKSLWEDVMSTPLGDVMSGDAMSLHRKFILQ